MIIDHNNPEYRKVFNSLPKRVRYNGAFYYSKEIVKNIIPKVNTDRNWITIKAGGEALDHSIIFIHNNLHIDKYDYLKDFNDLILICGVPETCEKVEHLGTPLYLPLSVDVNYVKRFRSEGKNGMTCFAGRKAKLEYNTVDIPAGVDILEGVKRQNLLPKLAEYSKCYAVGRTAIEAKILGCQILPYDSRYPDPSIWRVMDNSTAAKILQKKLDEIDG